MKSIKFKKGTEYYYPYPYFPIGYIYLSTSNVNPSTYFGGTWERIQGKFLLCANDSVEAYKAGKTGGSENVTLTVDQIPAHAHGLNSHTHSYSRSNDNTNSHTLTINEIPSHKHTIISWRNFAGTTYGEPVNNARAFSNIAVNGDGTSASADNFGGIASAGGGQGHTHGIGRSNQNTGGASGNTANSGGSKSHTNMPPFLAIYAWKRTK